jgi:hypothetical protein
MFNELLAESERTTVLRKQATEKLAVSNFAQIA